MLLVSGLTAFRSCRPADVRLRWSHTVCCRGRAAGRLVRPAARARLEVVDGGHRRLGDEVADLPPVDAQPVLHLLGGAAEEPQEPDGVDVRAL